MTTETEINEITILNSIENEEACTKLKTLYKKYFPTIVDDTHINYNIKLLNKILLKTIPTPNIDDSNFLLDLGANLTEIPANQFYDKQLTSINIPNTITTIDIWAFQLNNLTSVIIPNSVTTIDDYAFQQNKLESLIIPNSVTNIGANAFANNQLTLVTMPRRFESRINDIFGTVTFNNITFNYIN